jgi:tetratricopeptide (TPR) repeat protein
MKARNKHVAVGVAVVVAVAVALGAYASMQERGEELFREGVRLANEGDYLGALHAFERAMAYTPRLNVLWNIACCHVVLGGRDLAVACLDRYMEHDVAFQQSAEMQAVVAAIAAEPQNMPDVDRRGELWDQVEAASRAVEEGRATSASAEQRGYGVGNRGARIKTGESSLEWQHAQVVTARCTERADAGDYEEALAYAERAAAYSAHQNVYWNIAVFHLKLGHRDFFLDFMDVYQQRVPQVRESAEFQQVMADIADAPPVIPSALRERLDERVARAVERALPPRPTPSARPSVRTAIGDEN